MDRINCDSCVPVVMAFDPNFLFPSAVTMLSALESGRRDRVYHFHILTEPENAGMDNGLFQAMAERYPNFRYEYRDYSETSFRKTRPPLWTAGQMSFARLFIAERFPELDACLYIDGDTLVRSDLAELFRLGMERLSQDGACIAAAPDLTMLNGKGDFYQKFREGLGGSIEGYFNAGVMVMDLKSMREKGLADVFRSRAGEEHVFGDQDILYITLKGKTCLLPVRWNVNPMNIGDETATAKGADERDIMDIMTGNAAILHFAGRNKPWRVTETRWDHEWHMRARSLPACGAAKEFLKRLPPDFYDPNENIEDELRRAGSYVIYGFTDFSRKLADRLERRGIRAPLMFIDNHPAKRGLSYKGTACLPWSEAKGSINEDTMIVIAARASWRDIQRTLLSEGIARDRLARFREKDLSIVSCAKEYDTGLIMGVFDLFHIGHLNLIRRAKERSRFLRVGLMSDDLTYDFKRIYTTIPQEERKRVLEALSDVDEVVMLEKRDDVSRINEWEKRPFDCFFSGDDYEGNPYWEWERQELRKRGADLVFFPYTKEQSSTAIRNSLKGAGEGKKHP